MSELRNENYARSSLSTQSSVQLRSSGWAAALLSLTITTTVLLLMSVVITAFVTTTLLGPGTAGRAVSEEKPLQVQSQNAPQLSKESLNPGSKRSARPCDSTACIEQAKLLLRQINASRDPCEDFYAHVCEDWGLTRPLPPGAEKVSVDTILLDGYTELLASGLKENSSQFPELQFLLDRCFSPEPNLFDSLLAMFLDATNLRSWMTKSSKRNLPPGEVSRKMALAMRELGVDAVFRLFVVKDPVNETKRYIGLDEPSTALLHSPLNKDEYELVRMGFTPVLSYFQGLVDTDLLQFEERLSRLFTLPQLDIGVLANCTIIKVRDLPTIQGIEWNSLLQSVFGKGLRPISARTYIKLASPTYLMRLSQDGLLRSPKDVVSYLLFRIMMTLSPLMSDEKLRSDLSSVSYARHPEFAQALPQSHYCLRLVDRFEPYLPLYVSRHFSRALLGGKSIVDDLVSTIRLVFLEHVQEQLGHPSSELKAYLRKKLSTVSWEPLVPRAMEDDHLRARYTEGIYLSNSKTSTAQFFYTWIRKSTEKRLLTQINSRMADPGWTGGFLAAESRLGPPYERIEIPLPVFDFFMNSEPALRPLQLPRAAPKIYRSLFKAIYHWIYNFEFENERDYSLAHSLKSLRLCLERQYSSLTWTDKRIQLNTTHTSWSDLWDHLSLTPALKVFLLYASRVSPNYRLRLLEHLNASQLFFILYAANFCENNNRRFLRRSAAHGPNSPAWFRVNGPLRNMPEFARSFNCKPNAFMNPLNRCSLPT